MGKAGSGSYYDVSFNNLSFIVTDRETGGEKRILNGVTGACCAGRLLAIMGASGAGKTTLLDVLACNTSFSGVTIEGDILVNGRPRNRALFSKMSCYVQQKDVLPATATVREALLTAALLRMPLNIPLAEKKAAVESVLGELDLMPCANTRIGDELMGLKGISGGQKRRVSVGIELVKDPRIIFLDEPTSGLDSAVAKDLMELLITLARRSRTVICTIHQPSSDITDQFDDFLLLSKGRVLYNGLWAGAVNHFQMAGYSCPTYKNPTDFFMSVIRDPEAIDSLAVTYGRRTPDLLNEQRKAAIETRIAAKGGLPAPGTPGSSSAPGEDTIPTDMEVGVFVPHMGCSQPEGSYRPLMDAKEAAVKAGNGPEMEGMDAKAVVPIWFQVAVLVQRNFRNWLRNPMLLSSELVQYVFLSLLIGLMYVRFNDRESAGFDRAACMWFAFTVLCFSPSFTAITVWERDRHLLKRELRQRQYHMISFTIARNAVLVPFEGVQVLLFTCILYWLAGFQPSAANFFMFFWVLWVFQLISEGLGLICAAVTSHATYAVILVSFVLLLVLAFSGFLTSHVPVYFAWIGKASYFSHALAIVLRTEFKGLVLYKEDTGKPVDALTLLPPEISSVPMAANIAILLGQLLVMEVVKLGALILSLRFDLM